MGHAPPRGAVAALVGAAATAGAVGCARQGMPSGGTPDQSPPAVIAVRPEAGGLAEDLGQSIRIQFNERISERTGGGTLADAVLVSPATGQVSVSHKRDALEVELEGGLQPGLVYVVTVQPVIIDLFNNPMPEAFEFAFSTGAAFHETAVAGLVVDRLTGDPAPGLAIEARAVGGGGAEDVAFAARTDGDGLFTLRYLPPGAYRITAYQDRDQNSVADPYELQGSSPVEIGEADTVLVNFPILQPDTTPAVPVRAEVVDAQTLRITFDDHLDPEVPLTRVASLLEDTLDVERAAPTVTRLLHDGRYQALQQAQASAAGDTAATDSAQANPVATDTATADTAAVGQPAAPPSNPLLPPVQRGLFGAGPGQQIGRPALAAAARAPQGRGRNLLGLTLPSQVAYVELADTLPYDVVYRFVVRGVTNLAGLESPADTLTLERATPAPPG